MIGDRDFTFTHANPASIQALTALADWLPVLPEWVVGSSLDIFHKTWPISAVCWRHRLTGDPAARTSPGYVATLIRDGASGRTR